jgi:hypothetical protein
VLRALSSIYDIEVTELAHAAYLPLGLSQILKENEV